MPELSGETEHDACAGQWCCGCDVHPVGKPWGWNSSRWDEHYAEAHSGRTDGDRGDEGGVASEQIPGPSFERTFSWLDGGEVDGAFGWMTSEDAFDGGDEWEPRAYLVETWERTAAEVRWAFPPLGACSSCDEDAVAWQQEPDGAWMQACERHRTGGPDV